MRRAGLSYRGKLRLSTTSQSASQTAPLVGEPLAKPFTLRRLPRPLPLGEVARHRRDGEGKPGRKEPLRSDRQALCRSDTIAEQSCLAAALPSQSHSVRQLPQRGSHWHVGQLSSGRAKHDAPETVVLRCLGQRQLDKERLSRSCCPL